MRIRRLVLGIAALAVAAPVAPASAARPPELGATTTITTRTSGYVDVRIPRDARLSPAVSGNPDVRFSGKGRLLGFWLTRIDPEASDYSGVFAYRLPAFAGGKTQVSGSTVPRMKCHGVPSDQVPLQVECDSPKPTAILLPAGRYRMTVLTDGAPISVRIRLRGLGATTADLAPAHALASVQKKLPQLDGADNKLVTYGGSLGTLGYSELFLVARATYSSQPVYREMSACTRRDSGTQPGHSPTSCRSAKT